MSAHKQILWHTLLKIAIAASILVLLLLFPAPTLSHAQAPELPPFDPGRLVFETLAGDYGNSYNVIYNVIRDQDGFLWLTCLNGAIKFNGYEVETIYSGETVSALFEDSQGLIWMDIRMPGMDGFEVSRRLKADERTHAIPVVFISILRDGKGHNTGTLGSGADITEKKRAEEFEDIGLANKRRIIARHGGRTWAEEKLTMGPHFILRCP